MKHCQGCALHGPRNVPAVGTFRFPDGDVVPGCREHLDQWAVSVPHIFGPVYGGKVGSKGGGASAAMAAKLESELGDLQRAALRYVVENGPAGAEDVARGTGLHADKISPRFSELKDMGLVYKGPRTAETALGNSAHVYGPTKAGKAAILGVAA